MSAPDIEILFEGEVVGIMVSPVPDMWYLDGEWRSSGNQTFELLLSRQNLKENFSQQTGISVKYREHGGEQHPALAYGLADGHMLLRRMSDS